MRCVAAPPLRPTTGDGTLLLQRFGFGTQPCSNRTTPHFIDVVPNGGGLCVAGMRFACHGDTVAAARYDDVACAGSPDTKQLYASGACMTGVFAQLRVLCA